MKNVALITGASGGLGLEFAKVFAKNGFDLVLVARNEEKLKKIKEQLETKHKIEVVLVPKDLSVEDAALEVYNEVKKKKIEVEVLIHNAGFGDFGRYIDNDYKREREMAGIHVIATMQFLHLYGNDMVKRGHGRILNVTSIAAYEPGPYMPMYFATKGFIYQLTQAVAWELRKTGVTVTAYHPGPIATDFEKNADMKGSMMFKIPFSKPQKPSVVAEKGYKACMEGKLAAHPHFRYDAFKWITRMGPDKIRLILTAFINTGKWNP